MTTSAPDGEFILMLLTREPEIASAAVKAGVDRIFVDLETRGKAERQRGRSTIISGHTVSDVARVRKAIPNAQLLARVNPPGGDLKTEVDAVIAAGADVVMLPYFSAAEDVASFVEAVSGRAVVSLLVETAAAVARIEAILRVPGIDEVHVGLNDLHISMGVGFMHELLAGGIVDFVASRVHASRPRVRFGFGGGARLDDVHPVPPRDVLREHARLDSRMIILSRTFTRDATTVAELSAQVDLAAEVRKIREAIAAARARTPAQVEADRVRIHDLIWRVASGASR